MEDLYKHIESLGKEHGYKNMTVPVSYTHLTLPTN